MMENAARMQKWMLLAAPAMLPFGAGAHAGGGGLGLLLWLMLGLLFLPKEGYPYPRKRRSLVNRLFFAFALFSFFSAFCHSLAFFYFPAARLLRFLFFSGSVFFLLPPCAKCLTLPLSEHCCRMAGGALLMYSFIFYR